MVSVLEPPKMAPLSVHASRLANKLAVVDDRPDGTRVTWTFAELNREANRLAHVLTDLGVRPGDRVAWCGPNSPGIVRATHARAKLGVVGVPINYRLTPAEAAYIVDNSDSVVIYVDAEYAEIFTSARAAMPNLRHLVTFGGVPPRACVVCGTASCSAIGRSPSLHVSLVASPPDHIDRVESLGEHQVRQQRVRPPTGRTSTPPNPDPFDQQMARAANASSHPSPRAIADRLHVVWRHGHLLASRYIPRRR